MNAMMVITFIGMLINKTQSNKPSVHLTDTPMYSMYATRGSSLTWLADSSIFVTNDDSLTDASVIDSMMQLFQAPISVKKTLDFDLCSALLTRESTLCPG